MYHVDYFSLNELIDDIFVNRIEHSQTFSCYILLPCDRGPWPACLDWSEICDGKVDCLNGGIDENDCWQIEIHQCEVDEYRCMNGQCISQSFLRDNTDVFDCADKTDGLLLTQGGSAYACNRKPASVNCDDVIIEIDGKNETDETECDNVYTYCNNEWNCPNGRDELGCQLAPSISCSSNDRICVSRQTNQFMCLSMTKINDEKIDCLGGTNELKPCFVRSPMFLIMNQTFIAFPRFIETNFVMVMQIAIMEMTRNFVKQILLLHFMVFVP